MSLCVQAMQFTLFVVMTPEGAGGLIAYRVPSTSNRGGSIGETIVRATPDSIVAQLEDRARKDQRGDREVDHDPSDIDQGRDEGS